MNLRTLLAGAVGILCLTPAVFGQDETAYTVESMLTDTDTLWTCLAAFLVFFMQAGFTLVEAGLTRAKNVCNIVMKNLMDFSLGSILFWCVGFGIMFGASNGLSIAVLMELGAVEVFGVEPDADRVKDGKQILQNLESEPA